MDKWKNVVVSPETPLGETISRIEASAMQIAMVVDYEGLLVGVVTDGDIRRAMMQGLGIECSTRMLMTVSPLTLPSGTSANQALAYMRRHSIHHVPLTDNNGKLCGVYFIDELIGVVKRPNPVVIMAGGMGTRLRPLTDSCPKPLLQVGGKPILERILERFIVQGFQRFYISVNYKAEMIKEYFGGGDSWGVEIIYLHEDRPLGTAGSLSMLPRDICHPLIVMNGDLLTETDFLAMLNDHSANKALATIAARDYEIQIPFGVVSGTNGFLTSIQEKPSLEYLINAGIYIIEPNVLKIISEKITEMPTFFDKIKEHGPVRIYRLKEYWVDIGRLEDLENARGLAESLS